MSTSSHDASADDTLYVLVTGANNGLGFSICTRLITTFLHTRPTSSRCIHIIPTTRTRAKADATVSRLQAHIEGLVAGKSTPEIFTGHPSPPNSKKSPPEQTHSLPLVSAEARAQWSRRVTISPLLLDLCLLPSVYSAARELKSRYTRIDALICNAGIGGWDGIDWLVVLKQFFTEGLTAIMSRPAYKLGTLGGGTRPQVQKTAAGDAGGGEEEPKLGEVFCANVFGHYLLVHETVGLLSRREGSDPGERGRVVWLSTIEALDSKFDPTDIQGMKTVAAYESSKRLTDILFLSTSFPETQKWVTAYMNPGPNKKSDGSLTGKSSKADASPRKHSSTVPPKTYTCHPGIFVSSIMPLHPLLVYAQLFAFFLVRVFGSLPWLVVSGDRGATAPVWLALEDPTILDEEKADERKWGSCVFGWGDGEVMETEVDGLKTEGFGALAEGIWGQMEGLRGEWEKRCQ